MASPTHLGALLAALALAVATSACSNDNEKLLDERHNCGAKTYAPFDAKNHEGAGKQLAAHAAFSALGLEAANNIPSAAAKFAQIEALYAGTASLKAQVQAQADEHFPDDPAAKSAGATIDADVTAAIARGKAATTPIEARVAMQIIDKSLSRFFYLAIHHELRQGTRAAYDAAYGHLGTGEGNEVNRLLGIAKIAARRDGEYATAVEPQLFRGIIDGSCALDTAIEEGAGEPVDPAKDAAYGDAVAALDAKMLEVLAMSAAHEFNLIDAGATPEQKNELVYEGSYYFTAVEAAMKAKGGAAADDAGAIRASLDAALTAADTGDTAWQQSFDAAFIRDRLNAAFGIAIK